MVSVTWPWESQTMLHHPWAMLIFLLLMSGVMSVFTWFRLGKGRRKEK